MAENEYSVHVDFEKIRFEAENLQGADEETKKKIAAFLKQLKDTTDRIDPKLNKEINSERELWHDYRQLQSEKLAVLDLSHEWDYIVEPVEESNPRLDVLVRDAIEELNDHITVMAESHRAHIDILEIYNTRKIEILALVITGVISYVAAWEFFVRELLVGIKFPNGLSPTLNYVIVLVSLSPVFASAIWAWLKRKTYF